MEHAVDDDLVARQVVIDDVPFDQQTPAAGVEFVARRPRSG